MNKINFNKSDLEEILEKYNTNDNYLNYGEKIFIVTSKFLLEKFPFLNGNNVDILIMGHSSGILHTGWTGKKCRAGYDKDNNSCNNKQIEDIDLILDTNEDYFKNFYYFVQDTIIKPMIKCLLKRVQLEEISQTNINKFLGLDYLDKKTNTHKDYITREIIERLVQQGIVEIYSKKPKYIKVISYKEYKSPVFISIKNNQSKGHKIVYKILSTSIDPDLYEIEQEYGFENGRYKDTNRKFKYDIAVIHIPTKKIKFIIEIDGEQHFKYVSRFHGDGFIKQQKNDFIKNKYCQDNYHNLLRIHYKNFQQETIKDLIKYMMENDSIPNNIKYSDDKLYLNMINYKN